MINKLFVLLLSFSGITTGLHAQKTLDWVAPFGGSGSASITASGVATDNDGNVYTVGLFSGKQDFDPSPNAADTFFLTSAGGGDIFVSKLDADGKFLWAKRMGGTLGFGNDWAKCVAVDGAGSVYLAGIFMGKADFDPSPNPADTFFLSAHVTAYMYGQDAFVAKLDKNGSFAWARQFVGYGDKYSSDNESSNQGRAITVDKRTGDVYVTGDFVGKADFNPSVNPADTFFLTAADPQYGQDMYIAKLDSAGGFIWAKKFGGPSSVMGRGITLDPSGHVLTTGYYYNKVDFDPGEAPADTFFLQSANNSMDIFVSKLDSAGRFIWARSMGGPNGSGDLGNGIATDADGSVFTTGYFSGTSVNFNPDPAATPYLFNTLNYLDIFVSKLDSSGNFVWAKQMGSDGVGIEESGYGIVIGRSGEVLVAGGFIDTSDFNIGGGTPQTAISNGNRDAFIVSLTNGGDFKWLRPFGGHRSDAAWAITMDGSGNVYSAGTYLDTVDFDPPHGRTYATPGTQLGSFTLKLFCTDTSSSALSVTTCENSYTLNGETYTQSGTYVQVLPNAEGCDSTITLSLTIAPVQHPAIRVNEFVLSTTRPYSHYHWMLETDTIPGATDSTYAVTANGNYRVIVTNDEGCSDTSDVYPVTNVSVASIPAWAQQVYIYPNPAHDVVYIRSPENVTVTLTDIRGRAVRAVPGSQPLPVGDLPDGIYLLRIAEQGTGQLLKVEKLVKQRE